MRKRIVVSMLVIALAAALLGGAAFAWFTDNESATATFTAGTIKLGELGTTFTVSNMAPGDVTTAETLTITNSGSLEMFYRISFVKDVGCEGTLGNVLLVYIDGVAIGTLEELQDGPFFETSMRLLPEGEKEISVSFELPGTTGNIYQGQTYTGKLVVQAVQVKNNADEDGNPITWSELGD